MEESVAAPVMGDYYDTAAEKFSCQQQGIFLVPMRNILSCLFLGDA